MLGFCLTWAFADLTHSVTVEFKCASALLCMKKKSSFFEMIHSYPSDFFFFFWSGHKEGRLAALGLVYQASLEFISNLPASASWILKLKMYTTMLLTFLHSFCPTLHIESWGEECGIDTPLQSSTLQRLLFSACWQVVGSCVNWHLLYEVSVMRVEWRIHWWV